MNVVDLQSEFKRYALYEKKIKPKGYKGSVSSLRMLCEFSKINNLKGFDENIIRGFFYHGSEERLWKSQTFRNHWHHLNFFFKWCQKKSYITDNPLLNIEKPKRDKILPRCITTEEAKRIQYHAYLYDWVYKIEKYRNHAIISTFLMAGLRLQELLDLKVYDINFSAGNIFVRQGKGNKDRYVPIYTKLEPVLREYVRLRKPNDFLFTSVRSNAPLRQKDISSICKKISIASEVKFTPHMLRHTFARELIDNDFNLYKLKEIMGHACISTTQRYLAISTKGIKHSMGQINIY